MKQRTFKTELSYFAGISLSPTKRVCDIIKISEKSAKNLSNQLFDKEKKVKKGLSTIIAFLNAQKNYC